MNPNISNNLRDFGDFRLDAAQKILWRGDEVVSLPLKAVELLCVLVENRGEVVSKNDLLQSVWTDSFVEESVLTQNIYLLRKTLQTRGGGKNIIKNVPRRGYMFNAEVETAAGSGVARAGQTNGAETFIERHLFEKIQVEQIQDEIETQRSKDAEIGRGRLLKFPASPFLPIAASIFAAASLAGLIIGAYFYFRGSTHQEVSNAVPAVRLKTVSEPSAVKTLAILPFQGADERLASKFADNLSIRLGSVNKFNVMPLAMVKEYEKYGASLTADFVVDGEVQAVKDLFTANVRLLDAKTGTEIWTKKFEYDNHVQLEDATANQVSKEILYRLSPAERESVSKRLPTNFEAYINYQKGQALWRKRRDGSVYFQKATELDQSFTRAYAALANIRATSGMKDSLPAREAEELLQKAFELDDNSADAYAVQGFIRIFHHRDWKGAEKSLKNALELDGNNINARHWLGVFYSIHRRLDEAKTEMHMALEFDPTNPTLLADIGQLHYFAGENDLAAEFVNKALGFDPDHEFARHYTNLLSRLPESENREAILNELNAAAVENAFTLPYINVDPRYEILRGNKRFAEILRTVNFSE